MRLLRYVVPLLVALLAIGGSVASVAAQDGDDFFDDADGIQKAYGRTFTADMAAMMDPENPDQMPTGWMTLTIAVLEFDNADNASAAGEKVIEAVEADMAGSGVELEDVELDLDLDHVAKSATMEEEGVTTNVLQVFAHKDNYLYMVVGMTFGDDPTEVVTSVTEAMAGADASDDEEMFHEDGTSMGGLWAKMPSAEDVTAQAEALTTVIDEIYYPEPESTPAA